MDQEITQTTINCMTQTLIPGLKKMLPKRTRKGRSMSLSELKGLGSPNDHSRSHPCQVSSYHWSPHPGSTIDRYVSILVVLASSLLTKTTVTRARHRMHAGEDLQVVLGSFSQEVASRAQGRGRGVESDFEIEDAHFEQQMTPVAE